MTLARPRPAAALRRAASLARPCARRRGRPGHVRSRIRLSSLPPPAQPGGYVVRARAGHESAAEALVRRLGGTVRVRLKIIDGFSASLPETAVAALRSNRAILSVTRNRELQPQSSSYSASYDPGSDPYSMSNITQLTGARAWWNAGYTGQGVDVALIDSGVAPGPGPRRAGQDRQRAGPLARVAGAEPPLPRHVRARHVHGRPDRRARRDAAVADPTAGVRVPGIAPGRPDRLRSRSATPTAAPTSPGDRRDRLGRPARTRQRPEHPRDQPLLRHELDAGLPSRPARVRGRAGVEERASSSSRRPATPATSAATGAPASPTRPSTRTSSRVGAPTPRDDQRRTTTTLRRSPRARRGCGSAARTPTSSRRAPTSRACACRTRSSTRTIPRAS